MRPRDLSALIADAPTYTVVPTPEQMELIEAERDAGRLIVQDTGKGLALFVPFGEGRAIPRTVQYAGDSPFPWQIVVQVLDGLPRCTRIVMDAPPGEYISAEAARIPVGRLVEEAVLFAAVELDSDGNPAGPPIGERVSKSIEDARRLHETIEREFRRRARAGRRDSRVSEEKLRDVARVYRENETTGRPAAAVEEHFKPVSRSTVGRWIRAARDEGLLGEAPGPGIGGELTKEDDNG